MEITIPTKKNLCKDCVCRNQCGNDSVEYCISYIKDVPTKWDIITPPFTDGQKKLIEMTEKLAEKRGGKICDVDGIDDDTQDIKELLNDTIKRIEEPTNEDWLHSLNTEQLAEWLHDITGYEGICSVCTDCTVSKHEKCRYNDGVDGWSLWLKQPHRNE